MKVVLNKNAFLETCVKIPSRVFLRLMRIEKCLSRHLGRELPSMVCPRSSHVIVDPMVSDEINFDPTRVLVGLLAMFY